MKNIIVIVLLIFPILNTNAQKCKNVGEWKKLIVQEYPNLVNSEGKLTYNRGRPAIDLVKDKLLENLFSDKFFIPLTGKSFVDTNKKTLYKKKATISKCLGNKSSRDELSIWLSKKFSLIYTGASYSDKFKWKIDWVNKSRIKYDSIIKRINEKNITLLEIQDLGKNMDNMFGSLFDSERKVLREKIKNLNSTLAKNALVDSSNKNCLGSDKQYIESNLFKRGYGDARLIYCDDSISYYWVKSKSRNSNATNSELDFQEFRPQIIGIFNVKGDIPVFKTTSIKKGKYYQFFFENPQNEMNLLNTQILSKFPKWHFAVFYYYPNNLNLKSIESNAKQPIVNLSFYKDWLDGNYNPVIYSNSRKKSETGLTLDFINSVEQSIKRESIERELLSQKDSIFINQGITKNIKTNTNFKKIYTDNKRAIEFYLFTGDKLNKGSAGVIAIHDKEDNAVLFDLKERFNDTYQLEKTEKNYLLSNLFPEIKRNSSSRINSIHLYNFIKNVHLNMPKEIYIHNYGLPSLNEGCISAQRFYFDDNTWTENLSEQFKFYNSKTLSEAINKRELIKDGKWIEQKTSSGYRIEKLQNIYGDFELIKDLKKTEEISKKYGYLFYNDNYWNDYNKVQSIELEVLKYTFHGNFEALQYLINYKEDKESLISLISNGPDIYFILMFESFFWKYSNECKSSLPKNFKTYSPKWTSKTTNLLGTELSSNTVEFGEIYLDPKTYDNFKRYFPRFTDVNLTQSREMKQHITLFFKKYSCDCKEMNQLYENLANFANDEKSIQKSHTKVLKGKKCN